MATTVLAFGSFDIVHPGHLSYLEKARALGTRLVVVVARDESIMRFKRRRPLFREEDRLRIIGALKPVDEAVLGNRLRGAGDMFRILKRYRPDIVALGYDQIVDAAKLRRSLRDYGKGPVVEGRQTILFCAWLAWSRYRVFIPILDRTLPTVIWCLDQALRRFGGCPTYGLSDNEKTLTLEHVAGIAIREPVMVLVGRWYGVSLRSCVPYDPESKGGSESTVRVAKADVVPTEANLLDQYSSFRELEEACREQEAEVNGREHRGTRRIPAEMVVEERARLHPLPEEPYTLAFGAARRVGQTTAMVSYEGGSYSVPDQLVGQVVWVRGHGEEVIMVHVDREGPKEVARHLRTTPGNPRVDDRHFPVRQSDPLDREPRARTQEEAEFLQLGPQAAVWLKAAGVAGAPRVRSKMALAVSLAKVLGGSRVAEALGQAAASGRFADGDLESIVAHLTTSQVGPALRPSDDHSLQGGTAGWAALRA